MVRLTAAVLGILCALLLLASAGIASDLMNLQVTTQHLVGGLIYVTGLPSDEEWPRASYSTSSDQYLVVFEDSTNNIDIKGRFIRAQTGETLGNVFTISGSSTNEGKPDVTYDEVNDRFLVVWEKKICDPPDICNHVIVGRLLYGEYTTPTPLAGSEFLIASEHSIIDLKNPRVAFNRTDQQYLVTFKRGINAVHGQMLEANEAIPQRLYSTIGFSIQLYVDGSDVGSIDSAWGEDADTFLVVWQNYKNFPLDGTIQGEYLHDTYQSGGQSSGNVFKLAPFPDGIYPLGNDCTDPVVAYDPINKNYIVLFMHMEGTDWYDPRTVYAQRVTSNWHTNTRVGTAFPVEIDLSEPDSGYSFAEIDYSGLGDTMLVVYRKFIGTPNPMADSYSRIYFRSLNGTNVSKPQLVRAGLEKVDMFSCSVTGTRDGRGLIVWIDELEMGSSDTNIVAARLAPYHVYLPGIFTVE